MTWAKLRPEMATEAARDQLSDQEFRLYVEVMLWLYETEDGQCRIPRHMIHRISEVEQPLNAAAGLVKRGWWKQKGEDFLLAHDAGTIRQSLAAQRNKKVNDAEGARERRAREREERANVGSGVGTYVGNGVAPPQASKQTTKQGTKGTRDLPVGADYADPPF